MPAAVEPLKTWFAKIDAVKDTAALQPVIAELHDIGVTVPFALSGRPTHTSLRGCWPTSAPAASALPDRDYYLKPEPASKKPAKNT